MSALPEAQRTLSVSQLNRQARVLLEGRFNIVWVRGELSNFRRPGSGHWYFTLKDDSAQVRCAMFVNRNRSAKIQPSDGQEVTVRGRVSLFESRGDFQVIVDQMAAAGEGALQAAFEVLKTRLAAEGLFDTARKRSLPKYPRHLAIITSKNGAALSDVLSVIGRRFPSLAVTLLAVAVQGPDAESQILDALGRVAHLDADVVLLTRGGGSLEDLYTFNSEPVARAIARCPVPTVAAVGHEIDFTIAEFVADLRAPTPSAAAELITPDAEELAANVTRLQSRLRQSALTGLERCDYRLQSVRARLTSPRHQLQQLMQRADALEERVRRAIELVVERCDYRLQSARTRLTSPRHRLQQLTQRTDALSERVRRAVELVVARSRSSLNELVRTLEAVSPLQTLGRGFAIVSRPDGTTLTSSRSVEIDDTIHARLQDGVLVATIREKRSLPEPLHPQLQSELQSERPSRDQDA